VSQNPNQTPAASAAETQPPASTPAALTTPSPAAAEVAKGRAKVEREPKLSDFATELLSATQRIEAMAKEAYAKNQDHRIDAAVNHFHEAGQWLAKAQLVLGKAGV
jgi:hypothetical protein